MINLQRITGTPAGISAALSANKTGNAAEQALLAANVPQITTAITAALSDGTHNGAVLTVMVNAPSPYQSSIAINLQAISILMS